MPALNYDYDYYEYRNGRRVTASAVPARTPTRKTVSNNRPATTTKKVATRTTSTSRTVTGKATTAKKRSASVVAPKKSVTKKVSKTSNARNTTVKKKTSIDIPLESSVKMKNKPKEMTLKKPKVKAKQKTNFVTALKNVAVVSVLFSLFFMICYRYSVINEEFSNIKEMKNSLLEIQAVNEQLQAEIESKTDLTYVENYAKYQLGMQKPTNSQMQYVNVEKQDKITTPVTIDEVEELNWFENIINEVRKIID